MWSVHIEKPVEWVGSSRKDIQDLPSRFRKKFGLALLAAQAGDRSPKAKPLSGFGGASVIEVVENYDTDTYRAIYTVRFQEAIYVLHVFQKQSRQSIQTPQKEIELVRSRLKQAEAMHADWIKAARGEANEP